jgi:hypothetical protein
MGTVFLKVNVEVVEVPPPSAGFVTETLTVAAALMSEAGMSACTEVELEYAVGIVVAFQLSREPETKLAPLKVMLSAAPPAVAVD